MENLLIVAFLIPFLGSLFAALKAYWLTCEILALLERTDYEKMLYLTSSSLPILKHVVGGSFIWVNPIRFNKFIKTKDASRQEDIETLVSRYRKNLQLRNVCFAALFILMLLSLCLFLLFGSP